MYHHFWQCSCIPTFVKACTSATGLSLACTMVFLVHLVDATILYIRRCFWQHDHLFVILQGLYILGHLIEVTIPETCLLLKQPCSGLSLMLNFASSHCYWIESQLWLQSIILSYMVYFARAIIRSVMYTTGTHLCCLFNCSINCQCDKLGGSYNKSALIYVYITAYHVFIYLTNSVLYGAICQKCHVYKVRDLQKPIAKSDIVCTALS